MRNNGHERRHVDEPTGGEVSEYTKMMAKSREQALDRMVAEAHELGANVMINVRFTTSMVMQGAAELLATGTAVVIEKILIDTPDPGLETAPEPGKSWYPQFERNQ